MFCQYFFFFSSKQNGQIFFLFHNKYTFVIEQINFRGTGILEISISSLHCNHENSTSKYIQFDKNIYAQEMKEKWKGIEHWVTLFIIKEFTANKIKRNIKQIRVEIKKRKQKEMKRVCDLYCS